MKGGQINTIKYTLHGSIKIRNTQYANIHQPLSCTGSCMNVTQHIRSVVHHTSALLKEDERNDDKLLDLHSPIL